MSDKAEELAKQLLEKTEAEKLQWNAVIQLGWEGFRTKIDDGYSFFIRRMTEGDNKRLTLELFGPDGIVLTGYADNLPGSIHAASADAKVAQSLVSRFRIFSDLFYAARRSSGVEDQTIEKVQQLLERLG